MKENVLAAIEVLPYNVYSFWYAKKSCSSDSELVRKLVDMYKKSEMNSEEIASSLVYMYEKSQSKYFEEYPGLLQELDVHFPNRRKPGCGTIEVRGLNNWGSGLFFAFDSEAKEYIGTSRTSFKSICNELIELGYSLESVQRVANCC